MGAAVAHPAFDAPGPGRGVADRDDPGGQHLELDDDVAGRLEDADAVVVAVGEHRGGIAAGDAPVPGVEVGHPVEGLARHPARAAGVEQPLPFGRQGRQSAVGGIYQQAGPLGETRPAHPVGQALGADRAGALHAETGIRAFGGLQAARELLVGDPGARPVFLRALEQDVRVGGVVERVDVAEVVVAPGRLGGRVVGRDRGHRLQIGRPVLGDGHRRGRKGGGQGDRRSGQT